MEKLTTGLRLMWLSVVMVYGIVSCGYILTVAHALTTALQLFDSVWIHVLQNCVVDSDPVVLGRYLFCFQ